MPSASRTPRLALIAGLVFALAADAAAAATMREDAIEAGGAQRSYRVYLPDAYDAHRRYPIVMVLHGGYGNAQRIAQQTRIADHVDRDRFIALLPNALGPQWNDGRETTRARGDDVRFLTLLLQRAVAQFNGDPQRLFVAGASSGGMMAQRLVCEAAGTVAGAAVVIANMPTALAATCKPQRPVPIVFFNADTDPLMPWAGGAIKSGKRIGAGGAVLSAEATLAFWQGVNGCSMDMTETLPDRAGDGTRVRLHAFASCTGAALRLYEIEGGGHTWPGGREYPLIRPVVGRTSRNLDATRTMLDWFSTRGP